MIMSCLDFMFLTLPTLETEEKVKDETIEINAVNKAVPTSNEALLLPLMDDADPICAHIWSCCEIIN